MPEERARFVIEAELSDFSHAELCRRYNISRPTGYKWLNRYQQEGLDGLQARSHRTRSCPHATPDPVVAAILAIRKNRGWGARKIRVKLLEDPLSTTSPASIRSTRSWSETGASKRRSRGVDAPIPVGLEQVADAVWSVHFGPVHLGLMRPTTAS